MPENEAPTIQQNPDENAPTTPPPAPSAAPATPRKQRAKRAAKPKAAASEPATAKPVVILKYHGADDGRYLAGVPRRDLTADDVRDLTGDQRRNALSPGPTGNALYTVTDDKAYRAALKPSADKES
jgi:hypothetical protein